MPTPTASRMQSASDRGPFRDACRRREGGEGDAAPTAQRAKPRPDRTEHLVVRSVIREATLP